MDPKKAESPSTEITVRSDDEVTGVDISFRGEPGRQLSGTARRQHAHQIENDVLIAIFLLVVDACDGRQQDIHFALAVELGKLTTGGYASTKEAADAIVDHTLAAAADPPQSLVTGGGRRP